MILFRLLNFIVYTTHYKVEYSHYADGRRIFKASKIKAKRLRDGFLLSKNGEFWEIIDEESGMIVDLPRHRKKEVLIPKFYGVKKKVINNRKTSWYKDQVNYFKELVDKTKI